VDSSLEVVKYDPNGSDIQNAEACLAACIQLANKNGIGCFLQTLMQVSLAVSKASDLKASANVYDRVCLMNEALNELFPNASGINSRNVNGLDNKEERGKKYLQKLRETSPSAMARCLEEEGEKDPVSVSIRQEIKQTAQSTILDTVYDEKADGLKSIAKSMSIPWGKDAPPLDVVFVCVGYKASANSLELPRNCTAAKDAIYKTPTAIQFFYGK
jgi:hypothetical protein